MEAAEAAEEYVAAKMSSLPTPRPGLELGHMRRGAKMAGGAQALAHAHQSNATPDTAGGVQAPSSNQVVANDANRIASLALAHLATTPVPVQPPL